MNTNMKKAVAGVVLGTFAFGVTTPAFAGVENVNEIYCKDTNVYVTDDFESLAVNNPIYVESTPDLEASVGTERGVTKVALDVIYKVVLKTWDEIPILKNWVKAKSVFLGILAKYYDVCDTVEEVLTNSFKEAFPNAPDAAISVAVDIIMFALPI